MRLSEILGLAPVLPVVTLDDASRAAATAQALVNGGLRAIEVTLRTPAGTVLRAADLDAAAAAGARFAVSPGATSSLLAAAAAAHLPYLPAVATASELMAALEAGFATCKFFPAASAGGVAALKAFAGPFPQAKFNPTGGIDAASAPAYLSLPNVICVGGSWVAPADAIGAGDFARIERLARAASSLR